MDDLDRSDVIVAGTGPAGLVTAIALARSGFGVRLVGPVSSGDDRRTTALMAPAIRLLDELGLRNAVLAESAPLRTMRIVDATRRLVRSRPVTFRATEIGEDAFGYNIPNVVLQRALERAAAGEENIAWTRSMITAWRLGEDRVEASVEGCSPYSAMLAVAADGRNSPARKAAGIKLARHAYRQAALVLSFSHARDHGFVSTEFHTETGPFTQVPLPGRRSSLVWVLRPERADELAGVDDEALSIMVEEQMHSLLGRIAVEPGRQVYPLSAALPTTFAGRRVALVGEAAHVVPPIGAQGLNLGLRDVRDLIATAVANREDPGAPAALSAYSARRRPDIWARAGAVNALNRSLLSDLLPAQLVRSAGLGMLEGIAPLRAFFMREGLEPGSGFAGAYSAMRKQIGR